MKAEKLADYEARSDLLKDRVILVTGAGSGIGASLARRSAELGATVVLLGRTTAKLESVYDQIVAGNGPQPGIFVMDLEQSGADQCDQLLEALDKTYGRLDGLVHNAGILGDRSPIEHFDVQTWQRVLHINVTAAFILTRTLFPLLRRSEDASVIFTSSGVGRIGKAFWGAYAVSKFATEGMMQVLADELGENLAIRSNAVNPGPTRTPLRRQAYPAENPDELAMADDILAPYLYLLGPDSKGVNGLSFDAQ
jgi:NAD(P)-dependent dehydrogenase (short-subunit alcohol dehydrogenase family)